MPRRIGLDDSTIFHVWNRGVDRQDIFTDAADQPFFEALLAEIVLERDVAIHAYSLMTNHFHLVIEATGAQLSAAMHALGRGYAAWYNAMSGRTGPLFDGRFGSVPICTDDALMIEARYVHRNPIDIVGVGLLGSYRFSSFGVYCGIRPRPEWLTTTRVRASHDDPDDYRAFVERRHPTDKQRHGSRPPLAPPSFAELERAVVDAVGVDPESLRASRRGVSNDPRIAAATLAVKLRIADHATIASRLGYASARQLGRAASTGRSRTAREPHFARLLERIEIQLDGAMVT